MRIVEIWDTRAQHDDWMAETIQPALEEIVGKDALASGPPPRITEFEVRRQDSR